MDPKKHIKDEEMQARQATEEQHMTDNEPTQSTIDEENPANEEETCGSDEMKALREERDMLKDKFLRLSAEFDNYRKRTMKEKAELILNGGEKSITSILPVVDDLERALKNMETATDVEAVRSGVELIYNKFMSEAIAVIPAQAEDKKGKILDCVQTGYTLNDKVIRHAKVVVGE